MAGSILASHACPVAYGSGSRASLIPTPILTDHLQRPLTPRAQHAAQRAAVILIPASSVRVKTSAFAF